MNKFLLVNKNIIYNMEQKDTEEVCLTNLSPSLLKYFNVSSYVKKIVPMDWKPPDEYGLKNSFSIIPEYYQRDNDKILDIDYLTIILDDIRNLRKLNEYQLEFIKNLDNENKHKIILEFNKLFDVINSILN